MTRLADHVAFVTGAGGDGVGGAVARRLAAEGATVVVSDNHPGRLERITQSLAGEHGENRILGLRLDAADRAMIDSVVAEVQERIGPIDILINNAGVVTDVRDPQTAEFAELDQLVPGVWDYVMALDLNGPWYLTRAVSPGMKQLGHGVVVNVSSVAAWLPAPGEGCYAAAKAALQSLTRTFAAELGASGIRCNAVAPAHVRTRFIDSNMDRFGEELARVPLGRFATPQDVAAVVAFLCSDDAAFVSGETIAVSGGWYMQA
jgi:NAD(P)-dependent dehydrogenase (short-subunit alcohol dehydrogenase family)